MYADWVLATNAAARLLSKIDSFTLPIHACCMYWKSRILTRNVELVDKHAQVSIRTCFAFCSIYLNTCQFLLVCVSVHGLLKRYPVTHNVHVLVYATRNYQKLNNSIFRPHIRQEYPLNLSILLSGGKESKSDFPSNGEWKGISLALRLNRMVRSNADRHFDKLLSGAALQTAMFSDIIGSNGQLLLLLA